jgi:hypothetical protein
METVHFHFWHDRRSLSRPFQTWLSCLITCTVCTRSKRDDQTRRIKSRGVSRCLGAALGFSLHPYLSLRQGGSLIAMLASFCVVGLTFVHVVQSFPSLSPVLPTKIQDVTVDKHMYKSKCAAGPFVSAKLSGDAYVYKGMFGFGLIPSDTR